MCLLSCCCMGAICQRNAFPPTQLSKSCVLLRRFHFHGNLKCAEAISHVPHQSPRRNDSAGPSNLPILNKPFCTHKQPQSLIPVRSFFPPAVPRINLLLSVLGRKGHAGKSLWGSIRQFSVGSAADTQVIYSEGARARTGSAECWQTYCLAYLISP